MKRIIVSILLTLMLLSLCGCSQENAAPVAAQSAAEDVSWDISSLMDAYDSLSEEDQSAFYTELSARIEAEEAAEIDRYLENLCGEWVMEFNPNPDPNSYYGEYIIIEEDLSCQFGNWTGSLYFSEEDNQLCFKNAEDGITYFFFDFFEQDGFIKLICDGNYCYVRKEDHKEAYDNKFVSVRGIMASDYFGDFQYVGNTDGHTGYGPNADLYIMDSLAYDEGLIFLTTSGEFEFKFDYIMPNGEKLPGHVFHPFDLVTRPYEINVNSMVIAGEAHFIREEYVEDIVITEDYHRLIIFKSGVVFEDYSFEYWSLFPDVNYEDYMY